MTARINTWEQKFGLVEKCQGGWSENQVRVPRSTPSSISNSIFLLTCTLRGGRCQPGRRVPVTHVGNLDQVPCVQLYSGSALAMHTHLCLSFACVCVCLCLSIKYVKILIK